jgi:hypothetical protein
MGRFALLFWLKNSFNVYLVQNAILKLNVSLIALA